MIIPPLAYEDERAEGLQPDQVLTLRLINMTR